MQKVTPELLSRLQFKNGRRSRHPNTMELYDVLRNIDVDEAIIITKSEWQRVSPPSSVASDMFKGHKTFKTQTLADDSGWMVKRVR